MIVDSDHKLYDREVRLRVSSLAVLGDGCIRVHNRNAEPESAIIRREITKPNLWYEIAHVHK